MSPDLFLTALDFMASDLSLWRLVYCYDHRSVLSSL